MEEVLEDAAVVVCLLFILLLPGLLLEISLGGMYYHCYF